MSESKHQKTFELRRRWTEYIEEINRMRWNIVPDSPEYKRFMKAFTTLLQIAQGIKSTAEIEEDDIVTNGSITFEVLKVEEDRVYNTETTFYHSNELRIKKKFSYEI